MRRAAQAIAISVPRERDDSRPGGRTIRGPIGQARSQSALVLRRGRVRSLKIPICPLSRRFPTSVPLAGVKLILDSPGHERWRCDSPPARVSGLCAAALARKGLYAPLGTLYFEPASASRQQPWVSPSSLSYSDKMLRAPESGRFLEYGLWEWEPVTRIPGEARAHRWRALFMWDFVRKIGSSLF